MEKMICIPVWRYELMLKTFDQAMKELEELKKALAEAMELVDGIAPGAALENFIKNDANVDNSQREHMPLGVYNRSSAANKQMAEVADEILERIRQRSEKVVK